MTRRASARVCPSVSATDKLTDQSSFTFTTRSSALSQASLTVTVQQRSAGDVAGRPVVVDDMISTGATIEAAARVLLAHGGAPAIVVAATHGLLVAGAVGRLGRLPVQCTVTTDSLPRGHAPALPLQVESIAPLLADAVSRLHHEQPLGDLLTRS